MSTLWNVSRLGAVPGRAVVCAALVIVVACGDRGGTAAGEAAEGEVAALDYEVTPDRYQRWVGAQQALDAIPGLPAPPKIDPMRLDEQAIRRAVEYLEGDSRARAALARAGISARDYVLTTVALDQALVTASAGAAPPAAGASPSPASPGTPARPTTAAGSQPGARASPRARPRVIGAPQRNVELVRRNRADVVRVLRTMRFRIAEPSAEDITDTSVTRTDSVTVGKDLTVKWDITVRRNRDTSQVGKAASAARDSARPDSTEP
jgi:hypothetical protein